MMDGNFGRLVQKGAGAVKRSGMTALGLLGIVLVAMASISMACESAAARSPADVNDVPAVVSPGNADKAPGQLLQEDQLNRVPPAEAEPVKKQLMTWADAEKLLGGGGTPLIARDRQVWFIQVHYPNGTDTKAGFIADALVTEVVDAETGQSIITKVERQPTTP